MAHQHSGAGQSFIVALVATLFVPSGYAAHSLEEPRLIAEYSSEPSKDRDAEVWDAAVLACLASQSVAPVPKDIRISSSYGYRRGRTTGRRTFHAGLDFAAPRGTTVRAVRSGTVELVALSSSRSNKMAGYGNVVVIYHPDEDYWTIYAHLDSVDVYEGMEVEAGHLLGRVGNTSNGRFPGMATHLHFEVRERAFDGDSPVPGPYRVNNIDPRRWLERHDVSYRRGRLQENAHEEPSIAHCMVEADRLEDLSL